MVKKKDLTSYLSHLVAGAIVTAIIVVLIVISNKFPGISKTVFRDVEVYHLVILVFVLAIIGILFNVRTSAQTLLGYLLSNRGKRDYNTVEPLSQAIINLAYATIIYFVALFLARKIVYIFSDYNWILTVLTLTFVVVLLVLLFFLYQGIRVYLENKGLSISERLTPPQEETSYIVCPNCGFKNPPGSKFCVNCGADISEIKIEETTAKGETTTKEEIAYVVCPKCGFKNPPGSKFCVNCGTPLEISRRKTNEKIIDSK
jgi:DNA-directed RNA polymerase subunit RPC12/RpoP